MFLEVSALWAARREAQTNRLHEKNGIHHPPVTATPGTTADTGPTPV